jgi:hypothetical protein
MDSKQTHATINEEARVQIGTEENCFFSGVTDSKNRSQPLPGKGPSTFSTLPKRLVNSVPAVGYAELESSFHDQVINMTDS